MLRGSCRSLRTAKHREATGKAEAKVGEWRRNCGTTETVGEDTSRKRSQPNIEMDDLEEIDTRVKHIRMSPSEFARHSNYSKQLKAETPPIINCHPTKNFDVPVLLYHEIFGRFLSYFENDTLTDNDKVKTYNMQSVMSDFYESEAEMAKKFRIWARSFFDCDTTAYDFIDRSQIDGVWREEIHGNTILLAIFKFKRDLTCCPCFLVYNIGHFFGIADAVVGKQITITPFIQGTLLFQRESHHEQYGNSGPSLIRQTSFLYINSYMINENRIEFCYSKRIIDSNGKLVFQVEELQIGIKRILKFVTSYGVEVHKYCYAKSITPELISVNTVKNTDYIAIIMEDLSDMQFEPLYEI
ncbi:2841_t:CDS:2 [Funneliformis caledonium]|uniref:2841_t:CDS:1 n=1 Tax=Funneliformis caledonium TaxID=1117310 RepID=A0A9N9HJJ0_9GLOM|nr:2841_t:CDS:2 [Funneliformis caledonium]